MNQRRSTECPELFFARENLDAPEVKAHLRQCELCRTLLGMATMEPPRAPAGDVDCIVKIAPLLAMMATGQLTAEDRLILTNHLATCRDCAAAAIAEPVSEAEAPPARRAQRANYRVVVVATALAVAAGVLLMLLHQRRTGRSEAVRVTSGDHATATAQHPDHGFAAPAGASAPSRRLQVIAELVDLETGLPDCGTLAISVTAKYHVVEVRSGAYPDKVLYVNHLCPEMSRQMALGAAGGSLQQLRVGDVHRLELRRADVPGAVGELTNGAASFDEYGDPDTPRYWADRTDLVKEVAASTADRRCLPVVAAECGCVYGCGVGVRDESGHYQVTHSFWKDTVLRAKIDRWCVGGECTEAFFAEIVCSGICPPRPADPTCHFEADRCVGDSAPRAEPRESAPDTAPPGSTNLVIEARLRRRNSVPACGILAVAEALEYDVVKVVRGDYAGQRIYVIQRCPIFAAGELHRLVLSRQPPRGSDIYSVVDTFEQNGLDRYWAIQTKRIR